MVVVRLAANSLTLLRRKSVGDFVGPRFYENYLQYVMHAGEKRSSGKNKLFILLV